MYVKVCDGHALTILNMLCMIINRTMRGLGLEKLDDISGFQ